MKCLSIHELMRKCQYYTIANEINIALIKNDFLFKNKINVRFHELFTIVEKFNDHKKSRTIVFFYATF